MSMLNNSILKSTHKNDQYLHFNENTHTPEKYVNKNRNFKPFTYDYRNLFSNQVLIPPTLDPQKKQQIITPIQRSPLYEKLNTEGDIQNKQLQKRSYSLQQKTPTGKLIQNQSFHNQQEQISTFSETKDLNVIKIPSISNPSLEVQRQMSFSNNGLLNNNDLDIIRHVQGVLQKKEKNHHQIYKMLEDQKNVVNNLMRKYRKAAFQEEKVLKQKMRELDQLKENYINTKKNEEMLQGLQIQIGIRMKDYKANQQSMNNDIMSKAYLQKLNDTMNSNNDRIQSFQTNDTNDNSILKNRHSQSVHEQNQKRWDNYTYFGSQNQISDNNIVTISQPRRYNKRPKSKNKIKQNKVQDFQF